ncbi:MAG: mannose-1-phosphate guanylyltransferase/mannose-6-phosphate isomerase [Methyloligellaceae bacterium]
MIYPFILSGGSGTRLWPLSRETYPKQFIKLITDNSLLQETCIRLQGEDFAPLSFLTSHEHRFIVAEQMQAIGLKPQTIILEPVARNTAPPALIAALYCAQQSADRMILLLPSDHIVSDNEKFRSTVLQGVEAAAQGHIVTFGIQPDCPETGYGYIESKATAGNVRDVVRFVEKPDLATAQSYIEDGNFLWNAGIFLYTARAMIDAFEKYAPDTLAACKVALSHANKDLDFLRLDRQAYSEAPDISIDYAIMEKTGGIKTLPLDVGWSDLGSWPAVWDAMEKDANGNVGKGKTLFLDTSNSFAHSEDGAFLSLIGLDNIFAVAMRDAIVVASKDQAQKVKQVVELLKERDFKEATQHSKIYRPWGWYEGISLEERYQVKRIMVNPGASLSLQSHMHRAEHWVVVKGTLEVTIEDQTHLLTENESTYIPLGRKHRLANPGKLPAYLIEVQSGSYLGEDDIVRYEDVYGREEVA